VAIFCKKLLKGEKAVIYGDGGQTRDFVFVEDVVNANLLALKFESSMAFNVGTGIETNINELYEMIRKGTGSSQTRINLEGKPGEQRRSCIAYDKIKRYMGWEPKVKINTGIEKTVAFFKAQVGKE
jgi:UDP-glucose 4-epimerase